MVDDVTVFNIVLAKHCGLDWEEQENLQEAYDTYNKLSDVKRIRFDALVTEASCACRDLFQSFSTTNRTQLDLDIRTEIEEEIYRVLEPMIERYLS